MTIEFHCPHCEKILKTSDEKAGRQAACPGCGKVIRVPTGDLEPSGQFDQPDHQPDDQSSTLHEPNDVVPCPTCGEPIRYGVGFCRHCGVVFDESGRHREMRPFPAGEVIAEAFRIFGNRWPLMIGANLTVTMISALPAFFGAGLISLGTELVNQNIAGGFSIGIAIACLGFLIFLMTVLWNFYLNAGLCVLTLKVVREQPAKFTDVFSGGRYWGRFGINLLLYQLIVQLGFSACVIPGIFLAVIFMPFAFVLVDEDSPGIDCLIRAKKLTEGNLGSLFLTLMFAIGCSIAGVLCCFVGTFVAVPYVFVMMGLAYDRMTFQTPLNQ